MSSNNYSDSKFATPYISDKFINFVVYAEIEPEIKSGRRTEYVRNLQNIGELVQYLLGTIEATDTAGPRLKFAAPVAFTPQFGNFPARVTIVGCVRFNDSEYDPAEIGEPTTRYKTLANASTTDGRPTVHVMEVPGGGELVKGEAPVHLTDAGVAKLKSEIEGVCGSLLSIYKIEFSGVTYGKDGRSWPTV